MVIRSSKNILDTAVERATAGAKDAGTHETGKPGARPPGVSAPGMLLANMATLRELEQAKLQIEVLRENNSQRLIDPALCRRSRLSDRDETLLTQGSEWEDFLHQISVSGGNTVAILVIDRGDHYEMVFGHRRTAACLALGLKVKADVILEIDAKAHWLTMRRENEGSKDLSVIEKGLSFKRALDEGLFSKAADISDVTGENKGNISLALKAARIPPGVLLAIGDWREVTWAQARTLVAFQDHDEQTLLTRAAALPSSTVGVAKRVAFITQAEPVLIDKQLIKHGSTVIAEVVRKKNGTRVVTFNWPLSEADDAALVEMVEKYSLKRGTV